MLRSFRRKPIHQKSSVRINGRRILPRISSRILFRIMGDTVSRRFPTRLVVSDRIMPVWALNRSI